MKPWLRFTLLAVAAVIAAQLLFQRSTPRLVPGEDHPPLALPTLDGRAVDLAALRGKVVAVNFWATWCGPCQDELPALAQVWRDHQGRCFELLGVAEESAREDVVRMAPSIPYPILLDEHATAVGPWRVAGYPKTVVVDAEGKVRQTFQGPVHADQLEEAIRPLLPATCPRS
jgi:cytochrome c biogenesis protein CcmG, thiol:disulfide interchange protein DsbE